MGTKNKQNGFTIVEISIVVIVIAILVTITTVAINTNLARARETARETDAAVIMNALEKYYDQNGEYPYGADLNPTASPTKYDLAPVKSILPSLSDADLTSDNGFYFWAHPGSGFASNITHHNQMPKQYMYFAISPSVTVNTYTFQHSIPGSRPYYWGCTISINNSISGGFALAWRNETTGIWTFKKSNRGDVTIQDSGTSSLKKHNSSAPKKEYPNANNGILIMTTKKLT